MKKPVRTTVTGLGGLEEEGRGIKQEGEGGKAGGRRRKRSGGKTE